MKVIFAVGITWGQTLLFSVLLLIELHVILYDEIVEDVWFGKMDGSEFVVEPYVGMYQTICYAKQIGNSVVSTIFSKEFAINGVVQNILLYYPLGYLLPILFPQLKPKHVILIGCLCSIATEATQYLLKMGWCETDDVIHNTLGTAIGVWIWHLQSKRLNKPKSNELPKE